MHTVHTHSHTYTYSVHIYTHVCMYVCMYIHTYMHTQTYTHMFIHTEYTERKANKQKGRKTENKASRHQTVTCTQKTDRQIDGSQESRQTEDKDRQIIRQTERNSRQTD